MRPTTDHQRRDLKTATRALFEMIGMGVFADLHSRVRLAELSKYCSQGEERTIPIDILLDAELVAGEPIVLRMLARMQGYDLVRRADDEIGKAGVDEREVLGVLKEAHDVAAAWMAANADGRIDHADRALIRREIGEAVARFNAMWARI